MSREPLLKTSEEYEDSSVEGEDRELRIILVGKTGSGKSAAGNTILGRKEFASVLRPRTTTLACQRGRGTWNDRTVVVVDTADILSPAAFGDEELAAEVIRCIKLSRPGPHALVFVTQVGRFTAEDEAAAKRVQDVFGLDAPKHMVVLFTHKEDLGGEYSLREYVGRSENKAALELMEKCEGRLCAFNNRAEGEEREGQVSELMGTIRDMVQGNGGGYYVNELYLEPNITGADLRGYMAGNRWARQREEEASRRKQNIPRLVADWLLVITGITIGSALLGYIIWRVFSYFQAGPSGS